MAGWKRYETRNTQIRELRSDGKSIPAIAKIVGCSKSVVLYNCKDIVLTNEQLLTLRNKSKESQPKAVASCKKKHQNKLAMFRLEADTEFEQLRHDPNFTMFLGLYWGEGNKRNGSIGITNNDPGVIKLALYWFEKLSPDKPKDVVIRCYPEHDKNECGRFWEQYLGRTIRTSDKKWVGKTRRIYSTYGLAVVRYRDWRVMTKILRWLELVGSLGLWKNGV